MTPMVLRLEHQTLFFDAKCAQFVPLSLKIIARRTPIQPPSWLQGETTAQVCLDRHVPRHQVHIMIHRAQWKKRQFSRGSGWSFDSSAGFAFNGADAGDGRHFPHPVRDMYDVHDIPYYSRGGHQVPGVATDMPSTGQQRKTRRPSGKLEAVRALGSAVSKRKHRMR